MLAPLPFHMRPMVEFAAVPESVIVPPETFRTPRLPTPRASVT